MRDSSNCNNCIHKKLCVIRGVPSAFEKIKRSADNGADGGKGKSLCSED